MKAFAWLMTTTHLALILGIGIVQKTTGRLLPNLIQRDIVYGFKGISYVQGLYLSVFLVF